ncbi:hypothetical protein ACVWYT_006667 [Streptomyces sp. TE4109]
MDGAQPVQFGEQGAQRVAAVDVVGAVGADHDEAAVAHGAEEVGEEVAGGGVGPVQVFEDEDDGAPGGDAFQESGGELEEPGGAVLVGRVPVGLAEFGEQPGQLALLPGAGGGDLGGQGAAKGPQRGGERGVGQAVGADLDAAADRDDRVAAYRRREELLDQPGLADPRLAADEQRLRFAPGARPVRAAAGLPAGAAERIDERGELALAADEHGTDGPGLHAAEHRIRDRARSSRSRAAGHRRTGHWSGGHRSDGR